MNLISYVGIAEYKLHSAPGILACSALGSCVGVCLWDRDIKLAGLLHILLPAASNSTDKSNPAKFADLGIAQMVKAMEDKGAQRDRLRAKLVGGACLYRFEHSGAGTDIGQRNVEAAQNTLEQLKIPVLAQHTGGEYGRSIKVDTEDFAIQVTILSNEVVII